MAVVHLTPFDVSDAQQRARASLRRYAGKEGHYRNDQRSHFVGKLGESAADWWFRKAGLPVQSHWRDEARELWCDIEVGDCRIEMKTWSSHWWEEFGRSVAVEQFDRLQRKADVVVWATVEADPRALDAAHSVDVVLRGCSTLSDIREARVVLSGRRGMRLVKNYQVDAARPFSGLEAYLRRRYNQQEERHGNRTTAAP